MSRPVFGVRRRPGSPPRSAGLLGGLAVLALAASTLASGARAATFGDLAIVGGTLIDVDHGGTTANDRLNNLLLIRNGRFVAARGKPPRGTRLIDARGKYIVPGLIDGFGSLRSPGFADAYLYEGVTSVFVNAAPPGFDGEQTIATVAEGPRVLHGQTVVAGASEKQIAAAVPPADVRAIAVGVDMELTPLRRLIAANAPKGTPVIGEFARTAYPEAIRSGVAVLVGNDHYQTAFAPPEALAAYAADPQGATAGAAYRAACRLDPSSPDVTRFARLLIEGGTALMPRLSIEATADDLAGSNPWAARSAVFVHPQEIDDPVDPVSGARPYLVAHADRVAALQACARNRQRIDSALHRAGVRYLAGSGAPAYGVLPGGGLHEELRLLQQIGLRPREALASATSALAEAFGWKDVGRIEPGRYGDLLVLDRDPRRDVSALEAIDTVVRSGQVVDRTALLARVHATRPASARLAPTPPSPDADALLQAAIAAQGGASVLHGLKSVRTTGNGYRNMVEESERPEGPYLIETLQTTTLHDLDDGRYLERSAAHVAPFGSSTRTLVVGDGVAMRIGGAGANPGSAEDLRVLRERAALSPESLLLTAQSATDRRRGADVTLQGVVQNVVTFTLDGAPVRIFLNADTHLPTAVDYSGPAARSGYQAFLGDATQRTWYSFWWLDPGGLRYPMLWNVETNGLPDRVVSLASLQVNGALADPDLTIPEAIRLKFKPDAPSGPDALTPASPDHPAQTLAPGVVLLPGAWNVTLVRQDDGLVILEAPVGSSYSVKVLDAAERRFPGVPVKAVITTSDAWPHLAGIREYVARGIPIYALDRNEPILRRVISAPYASKPDALQRRPRDPEFRIVSLRTVVGAGPNRIELYPLRGETSERQMMAYFPALRLLYGSDVFQTGASGAYTFPQNVTELKDAVVRNNLPVERFFMMHIDPAPWSKVASRSAAVISGA